MSATVDGVLYTKIGTNEACVGTESTQKTAVPTSTEGEIKIASKVPIGGVSCTVTMLGYWAFCQCSKLTNIIIPDTVKTLKKYCLGTLHLTEPLILPSSITKVESYFITNWAYTLLVFCGTKEPELDSSFSITPSLTSITVPKNYEGSTFCTKSVVKAAATGCPIIIKKRIFTCFRKETVYPITTFLIHLIHISYNITNIANKRRK